jgi:hypothetical protein
MAVPTLQIGGSYGTDPERTLDRLTVTNLEMAKAALRGGFCVHKWGCIVWCEDYTESIII